MSFIIYDLILMAIFIVLVGIFLIIKRKKLEVDGVMFLYRTKIGLKVIDYLGTKYKKTLKIISYLIVVLGYVLMVYVVYMMIKTFYIYLAYPQITEIIKGPPLMLLIPYFPKVFGVENLFPSFPFIAFCLAIAIVALVHEGGHGIMARYNNIKIKSTGFGFLGPAIVYPIMQAYKNFTSKKKNWNFIWKIIVFILIGLALYKISFYLLVLLIFPILAFFVEQDDKQMQKAKIFPQLSILGAGVFANIVTAIIFMILLIGFFNLSYAPQGVEFNSYAIASVPVAFAMNSNITSEKITQSIDGVNEINLTKIIIQNKSYLVGDKFFSFNFSQVESDSFINIYSDQPAIRAGISGSIVKINNDSIKDPMSLSIELEKYKPGQSVTLETKENSEIKEYKIILGENLNQPGKASLGIVVGPKQQLNMFRVFDWFKTYGVYYEAKFDQGLADGIYYTLGWIILINFMVALFNMLPLGIFDGGRFFYLSILAITKDEKYARRAFSFTTWFFLAIFVGLMVIWALRIANIF
jgi:membrane-associated protease RseP (regulator of RpoE activity)